MKAQYRKVLTLIALSLASATALAQPLGEAGCKIAGPVNAPLVIEEFADLQCHYCGIGADLMKQALKDYPGQVKLIYRNMPLPFHPQAVLAAKALSATCMQSSELAYAFQNEIFTHQPELESKGEPYLYEVAGRIGTNVTQMKSDMISAEVEKSLSFDAQAASSHAFTGTPSFLVGTETIMGAIPYAELKAVIERQLGH